MKAKKCQHIIAKVTLTPSGAFRSKVCDKCKQWLSLGPANDANVFVEREIAAAALIASAATCWGPRLSNAEGDGYRIDDASPFRLIAAWDIGYLVRAAVDDDGDGRGWDVTRPIAEQLAKCEAADREAEELSFDHDDKIGPREYELLRAMEPDCRDENDTLYATDAHGRFLDQSADACVARDPELKAIADLDTDDDPLPDSEAR